MSRVAFRRSQQSEDAGASTSPAIIVPATGTWVSRGDWHAGWDILRESVGREGTKIRDTPPERSVADPVPGRMQTISTPNTLGVPLPEGSRRWTQVELWPYDEGYWASAESWIEAPGDKDPLQQPTWQRSMRDLAYEQHVLKQLEAKPGDVSWQLPRLPEVGSGDAFEAVPPPPLWQREWANVRDDYVNFYSCQNLTLLGAGFGIAAALANTNADQDIEDWYQDNVRSSSTDSLASVAKTFGNGKYVISAIGVALAIGALNDGRFAAGSTVGEWGENSFRGVLVGFPMLLFMQSATGASRPGESSAGSRWKPFSDNNGASGHAFMGAVPFITAAQMTDDPWLKVILFTASTLPGWSRMNDDAHYTSQVFLGWWIGYLACRSIDRTNDSHSCWHVVPVPTADGSGIGIMVEH